MSADKKQAVPANVYELLDRVAQQQDQQQKQLDMVAKGLVALSDKIDASKSARSKSGGDFITLLKELAGTDKKGSRVAVKQMAEAARYWAMLSDAIDHYRRPVLPYSAGDRFLMRAGARSVYEMRYRGVKTGQPETGKELTDEQLDRMLGFESEKEEEKKSERTSHKI